MEAKRMTPLQELRHSCAHILAAALLRLYPETQLDIGPPTDQGFYYDVDLPKKLTPEDLETIEKEMHRIVDEDQPFERIEVTRAEATSLLHKIGQTRYKLSRLADIPEGETISFYRNGEFIDLCAGPHITSTGKCRAFKLLNIAGAYHRGDENNVQLQRIYGTAFPTQQELDVFLRAREQARLRDHRKLGRELGIFHIDEMVGQGLVLWMPRGAVIRQELQNFLSMLLIKHGYQQVFTPHIGSLEMYRISGHFPYYKDSQYPPIPEPECYQLASTQKITTDILQSQLEEGIMRGFLLKPMNCPHHIKIYSAQPRSYRDLPVRLYEFGTVYRWEQSGELTGMTRVRGFTQDDGHIFCTEEQLPSEIRGCLDLVKTVLTTLGLSDYRVRVGLRDTKSSKYTGSASNWDKAETACRSAAASLGVPYSEEVGEAAFYGPKIDFVVRDVLGREWQLGTVQVDFNLPEQFNLYYVGADNARHRPVMIHRAPFGSLERFVGILIEHFAGDFPLWLAPEQARILTISESHSAYAQQVGSLLQENGIRVTVDDSNEKIGAKVRRAKLEKIPYLLTVGTQEIHNHTLNVESRHRGKEGEMHIEELLARLKEEICQRILTVKPTLSLQQLPKDDCFTSG